MNLTMIQKECGEIFKQDDHLRRVIETNCNYQIIENYIIENFIYNIDEINIINNIFSYTICKKLSSLGIKVNLIYQHPIISKYKEKFDSINLLKNNIFDKDIFNYIIDKTKCQIFFIDDFQYYIPLSFLNIPDNIQILCRYDHFKNIIKFEDKDFDYKKEKHYINQIYEFDPSIYKTIFKQGSIRLLKPNLSIN